MVHGDDYDYEYINVNGCMVGCDISSLYSNTSGDYNTVSGRRVMFSNTTGSQNTAFGERALQNNITGSGNVAVGFLAGYSETGSNKLYIAMMRVPKPSILSQVPKSNSR